MLVNALADEQKRRDLLEVASILAAAYLRLLSREATNRPTTGHLAGAADSSDSAPERLDFPGGTPMTCGGRDNPQARKDL